ncbi:sugar transferase [Caulobacter sp. NIBR2454]|uniref:sugar transferase n=1 Tax=Caulobacter sp. NIBR2454 TaxID=3015996 RepID=UPI0022B62506|nr:sugar transferase [Caulobacter sp. NIBR2454]
MKRLFDLAGAGVGLWFLWPALLVVWIIVKLDSPGPGLHWSKRVGRDNRLFAMPKFRTMRIDAPQVATHLFSDADAFLTPIGKTLRRFSIDELPQLWSVLIGDMSLVGPRPALFNQDDLVALRTEQGVHNLRPGLTGWAQINGRDEISIREKVDLDREYMDRQSLAFDLKILIATFAPVISGRDFSR